MIKDAGWEQGGARDARKLPWEVTAMVENPRRPTGPQQRENVPHQARDDPRVHPAAKKLIPECTDVFAGPVNWPLRPAVCYDIQNAVSFSALDFYHTQCRRGRLLLR